MAQEFVARNGIISKSDTLVQGGLTANTISATTYYNLPSFSGGTVTGPTNFTGNLSATTISATTYLNLPLSATTNTFVTANTFNNATYDLTLTRNDGTSLTSNLGLLSTDVKVSGGTYNINTGVVTFTNTTGGTFQVTGFSSGMTDTFVTGGTYAAGTATFTRSNNASFNVTGFNTGTVTAVNTGNGMNFTNFSTTGTITMGTPSSTTLASTNALTSNSHTHAFAPGGTVSQYITGAGTLVTFPTITNGTVTGSGTDNYIPRFNGTSAIENSIIYDNGSVGIGTTTPGYTLDINGNIGSTRYYQKANGVPTSNLGNPTVTEMALFDTQFNNKTEFLDPAYLKFYTSTDGTTWTEYTSFSDSVKREFVGGDGTSGVNIPNLTPYFAVEVESNGYVFLNALYMYWSSNSHSTTVKTQKRRVDNATWYDHTTSTTAVGAWPGHLYMPFDTVPFYPAPSTSTGHYDKIRFIFQPTWASGAYASSAINLYNFQVWGGYPAGKRNVYSTDSLKNITFPANVTTNATLVATSVAIGTTSLNGNKLNIVGGPTNLDQLKYTRAIEVSSTDLNNLIIAGFYDGSNLTNSPTSGWFYITVEKHSNTGSSDWVHQTATSLGSGNVGNIVYTRTKTSGTWTAWKTLTTSSDISGTTNYVSKFTAANSLGNSLIYDNGTNVGIGTTSPGSKLDVNGDARFGTDSSTGAIYLGTTGGANIAYNTGNRLGFSLWDGSAITERLSIIYNSGNVGIGTINPVAKLHVASGDIALDINQSLILRGSDPTAAYLTYTNVGTQRTKLYSYYGLELSSSNGSIYIAQAGNVGVGTTNPSSKLDVNGDIGYLAESAIYPRQKSVASDWYLGKFNGGSLINNALGSSGDNAFQIGYYGGGTFAPNIKLSAGGGNISYINSGNVGIGTSSPTNPLTIHKWSTGGNFSNANQLKIQSDNWGGGSGYGLEIGYYHDWPTVYGSRIQSKTNNIGDSLLLNPDGGNVGIGTSTPVYKLSVSDTGNTSGIIAELFGGTNYGAALSYSRGGNYSWTTGIGPAGGVPTSFFTISQQGTTPRLVIAHTSGNVGIGTTSPSSKLQISSINSEYLPSTSSFSLRKNEEGYGLFAGVSGSGNGWLQAGTSNDATNYNLILQSRGGNVGIGTTAPLATLHVSGNALISGNLTATTISATTYLNLPLSATTNTFVTANTFNNATYDLTLTRNDGTTLTSNLGLLSTDIKVTGGTYNINTGVVTFTNSTGGTFQVTGFSSGMTDTFTTGGTVSSGTATFIKSNGGTYSVTGFNTGTVTSVAALTLGTTGTDLSSTVANGTTTPVITLNVPTASASNRGALSSTNWTTFNNKIGGSGFIGYVPKFTGTSSIGNSVIYDDGYNVGIGTIEIIPVLSPVERVLKIQSIGASSLYLTTEDFNRNWAITAGSSGKLLFTDINYGFSRMTIDSSGNVGINVLSNLVERLEVGGNALIKTAFIGTISTFGDNYASFSQTSRAGTNNYSLLSENDGTTYINASTGKTIKFRINNIDKVILDSSGKFGIGTTTPTATLHVIGDALISGNLTATTISATTYLNLPLSATTATLATNVVGTANRILFNNATNTTTTDAKLGWNGTTLAVNGNISFGYTSTLQSSNGAGNNISLHDGTYGIMKLRTNSVDKIIINYGSAGDILLNSTSTGNVGIGTTSPTEKLEVAGDVKTTNALLSNQQNTSVGVGTSTVFTKAVGSYTAAFFDYVVTSGANARAGTVFMVINGSSVEFAETETNSIGSTTALTLIASLSGGNILLRATSTSGTWSVKVLARVL